MSRRRPQPAVHSPPQTRSHRLGLSLLLVAAAAFVGLLLYAPAFRGPFIFDDSGLPFYTWNRELPVSAWISGMRPALMLTYWLNRSFWATVRPLITPSTS